MGRETSPGCGGKISFLHRDSRTPARLSDELHAYASPNEVVRTSVQATKDGEQIGCGTASDTSPTTVVKHFESKAVLEKANMEQVTSEKCRKAEESQEMVVTAGMLTSALNGKHPSAEINFVLPKRDKIHRKISMLTEGGHCGRSEDYTLPLEVGESTTASSSRRSSGLSQVEGTTKCLEELVGHGEEELAEQHLRFERLQSFCEVVADEDYECVSFGCTLEVPASRNSNADVEAWRQCWGTAPADLPKVRRTSLTRPSKLHCAPCNSGAFIVAPSDTVGVHALDVFDEKTVAGNLHLIRESTEKFIKTVGITTKPDTSPALKGVHDTVTLVMGAVGSSVTGLEELSTLAEGPNCIACGRSMSCSRCYLKTAVSALLRRHNSISQPLANIGISSGILHACGADSDKCDQFLIDEGDSRKIGCFLSGGACGRCASNIYCLTCLEHMQEQTAGLRAVAEEGDLQATDGHQPNERRESVGFASLLALTATLPHPLFTNSLSGGRQESLQVDIRQQQLPEAAHCERTFPALFSAETGTRLGCKSVGIHEMAERYTLRARDNCAAITDRNNDTLRGINSICRATRSLGIVREVSSSDFGEPNQTASPPSVSGCVHSLRVEVTHDTTGNTWSAPVYGIKRSQRGEGDFEKQKYVTPVYPSLCALKRKASRWKPRTDLSTETTQSMNFTNEDVSRLVYGRTCVLEVPSCAQHKECSSINHAETGEGEHERMKVRPRQKVLTQRGLKRKNVVEFSCPARDLQIWEEAGSSVKCYSAGSSGQALRSLGHHAAYFFTQGRCSLSCTRQKSRRVSLDNTYREPCSAAARFSLVRQQRVEGAVLMQRSGHADAYATAEALGFCSGVNDQASTSVMMDSVNSFQGPRSRECSHQPHRVAPRKCTVNLSSAAPHQQIEVRTRVSSSPYRMGAEFRDRFRWQQDIGPLQLCSRCVTCTGSSSLHFSPFVLEGGKLSRGLAEPSGRTAVDFDEPPVLLGNRARLRRASVVCDNVGEFAGGSFSVQEQHGANVTHVCRIVLSPPDAEQKRRGDESTHAREKDHFALIRGTGRATQTEKWIEWDDSETVNSALFCKQQLNQTEWTTSVCSPVHIRSELTCGMQCDRAHWKHKDSVQGSASVCAPDSDTPGAATLKRMVPSWEERQNTGRKEEGAQWNQTFDSIAVATRSKNIDLDSPCTAKLPSLLYSGSSTKPTVHDAMIYGNLSRRGTDLTVHDWEVGQLGCVAAGSESKHGSSACTAGEDRSTTIALSGRTSETVSYCACDGEESPVLHEQGGSGSMQQGRERECHMIENDTQQPQAVEAANRHRLEVSTRVLPALTAKQGEQLACSWSARLTTATVSIGSSISTTSQASSYDHSTGSTPLCYSRDEQSEIGVSDSAPQPATHAAWTVGRRTSRVQERNDKGSRHDLLPPPIVLHCQHEPDLASQPLCVPFATLQAASKCHSRQSGEMYFLDTFEDESVTSAKKCDDKFQNVGTEALQPSAVHAVALELAVPSSGTPDVGALRPLSPHIPCITRCYEGGKHRAWKQAAQTARSVPGWEVQGSEKRIRIGHCACKQETQKTEKQARFGEQLIDNWISWREETALHWCIPAAGAVCWHPRFSKVPDTLSAGILHSRTKALGTDKPAVVLPSIDIPPFSSPSCYSSALAFSVETIQTDKGNPLTSVASQKHYAAEPEEVWKECSTPESYRIATTVSPHSSRQVRSKKRNSKAHRRDHTIKEGIKSTATEKQTVTDVSDYEKGRGEQAEKQEPGQFLMKEKTVTSSADALQNPHSVKGTGKSAPTGENVTNTSNQGTFLEFGTTSSSDNDFDGVKPSRMAGTGTRPLWGNRVVERGESVSGGGSLADVTPSTADADAGGIVRSDASLTEPYDVRGESRRRAIPKKGIQMKAREARTTRMVCRTRDKSVFSGEGTRKSWRTGADGKVLYDACGHKISGVWYDNGRRLWRVVFTQGERRRTKGFSLKQYGFEQARNLAVQCKLAIEARKALCEEETA